jgi:hypothetical protein
VVNKTKAKKFVIELVEGLVGLYMLGCTALVSGAIYNKHVKLHFSPVAVHDEVINGGSFYRHYNYGDKSVYKYHPSHPKDIRPMSQEFWDTDNNGAPDFRLTYIPSRLLPRIRTDWDNDPKNWNVERKVEVDSKYW